MDERQQARLQRAEHIAEVASELGIPTALIGSAALAVHGYVRATEDLDMGSHTDLESLRELQRRLDTLKMHTELRTPDADDLGGVLAIWEDVDEEGAPVDTIEIVNFANPFRPGLTTPARDAVQNAQAVEGSPLRCVQLPDLIALKLYAGRTRDKADVIDVLVRNPDTDLDSIRAVCGRYGFAETLEELITASRSQ
jgi:hypothetical protein